MTDKPRGNRLDAHDLYKIRLAQAGLSYRDVAQRLGCSKTLVGNFLNDGYISPNVPNFIERLDALLTENGVAKPTATPGRYWEEEEKMRDIIERQLLSRSCLKHFGLKFDPFYEKSEPYISKEFRHVADDLLDCVERVAFAAVIGQVGWGKTTLLQHIRDRVAKELPHVILAEVSVDEKRDIETKHIRDAVLEALDTELLGGRQKRSTDFRRLLAHIREEGRVITVIVDDAQWVTPRMMAQFKLFSEMEHGYQRLLGIILLGQAPELTHRLNAIRAAGWRAHRIYLHGLGSEAKAYIEQRIRVADASASDMITAPALERVCEIMRQKNLDYPLPLSALMSLMLSRAHEVGERRVPKEMVEEFFEPQSASIRETHREARDRSLSTTLGGGENHSRNIATEATESTEKRKTA